ncbi:hypothetical protein MWU52_01025 [Jannaschia sp. S6380]|uniref:hypothetical protein n=1 Tax=Jannaschia sp. S6380 TaxID=2926408 RepID=UPI001FF43032|nr:hypothetical protein [Jannaschia sp. S6380]MCK0166125.1 hypothetical protein [Jannaschia sp. S6380]
MEAILDNHIPGGVSIEPRIDHELPDTAPAPLYLAYDSELDYDKFRLRIELPVEIRVKDGPGRYLGTETKINGPYGTIIHQELRKEIQPGWLRDMHQKPQFLSAGGEDGILLASDTPHLIILVFSHYKNNCKQLESFANILSSQKAGVISIDLLPRVSNSLQPPSPITVDLDFEWGSLYRCSSFTEE